MNKFAATHVPSLVTSGDFAGWAGDDFIILGRTSKGEQRISHEVLL